MTPQEMRDHIKDQDKEIFDLIARCIDIINTHSLWGGEDEYTYTDGEVWNRFDPDYDRAINTGVTT